MRYMDQLFNRQKGPSITALVLVSATLFILTANTAGGQEVSVEAKSPATQQIEPKAGTWKTWVLTSGSQLRVAEPPAKKVTKAEIKELQMLATQRDAAALDLINYWDAGSPAYRWNEIALSQGGNTPRAARMLALVNVAIYDAMVAAWDSKYTYNRARPSEVDASVTTVIANPQSPSYPSEHAVAAGAASAVLAYLFPGKADFFNAKAEEAGRSRLLAGTHYASDVTVGLELGRDVAALVIARARTDGSDAVFTGTIPAGACNWKGTNPAEPTTGTWKTWVLTSGSQVRPGPPPACDSAQEMTELLEVKNFARTFETNRAAFFWQGNAIKTWVDMTSQKIFEYRLDENAPRASRIYALVSVAFYDATVACWEAKFTYWAIRPIQLDPAVTTLFATPNHPSYPSAHVTIGAPFAEVLSYLFPRDTAFFNAQAQEGANSRLWAGIHFRSDLNAGFAISHAVAQMVIDRAKQDGSQ